MALSEQLVKNLYKNGEWIVCAGVGCESMAAHDVVHEPDDGQRFYVPLCEPCIESMLTSQLEYVMEAHGFFGVPNG